MTRNVVVAICVLVALSACSKHGLDVTYDDPDANTGSTSDSGIDNDSGGGEPNSLPGDMGVPGRDTDGPPGDMSGPDADPPTCDPDDCGSGASCQNNVCTCDAGLFGNPLEGCSTANPCENVTCPAGSSCGPDGSCGCDPFFTGNPTAGCEPTVPAADLSARTAAQVCAIWTDTFARSSNDFWMVEPATACDRGVLHPDEMRTALHTTSRFRMLVGLHPVSLAPAAVATTQECTMMHAANNAGLNHTPPQSWDCFTQTGYDGCASSNLASGINRPAPTVALYVADNGVPSLGHRRWVFHPRMGATAFGHRGNFGAMYSFDQTRNHNPTFVAYPAPGPFPRDALLGLWSIHGGATYQDTFTVTVTNTTTNATVPVSDVTAPVFGNLPSTLAWRVNTNQLALDTTYRITITNGATVVREWETTLISCP